MPKTIKLKTNNKISLPEGHTPKKRNANDFLSLSSSRGRFVDFFGSSARERGLLSVCKPPFELQGEYSIFVVASDFFEGVCESCVELPQSMNVFWILVLLADDAAIFPFMSKGHTIPLLHLAQLIHRRRLATLTFFTTPLNEPFLRRSLATTDATIISLPFPQNIPSLPPGVESTDALPTITLFFPFLNASEQLRPHFEHSLQSLPSITFLISDGFLTWTMYSAAKFGIPRMVFYGMGNFAMIISNLVATHRPHAGIIAHDQPFPIPGFPGLELVKADLCPPFDDPDPEGPLKDFVTYQVKPTKESAGLVVNSFRELDSEYLARWNEDIGPKAWSVGSLCLGLEKAKAEDRPGWLDWLDSRSAINRPVLYVAFGSQADISSVQLQEIAAGLEQSGLDFLWIVRNKSSGLEEFEKRVEERGLVVREWVDQMAILGHESVKGFMSHCGWGSVMEAVSFGVPILAMPMMAEQHLNAKFVVEIIGAGLRARTVDGTREGLVKREVIEDMARELLTGEKGKAAAEKMKVLAEAARTAMGDGGDSIKSLESMIHEMSQKRKVCVNGVTAPYFK